MSTIASPALIPVATPNVKVAPLVLVQVLRALAATLVLIGHVKSEITRRAAESGTIIAPIIWPGGFGVDLFFCISGFIMVVSSNRLFGSPDGRRVFIARRASRLVPLYWLVTLLPALFLRSHSYTGSILAALATSLAFIPYPTYGVDNTVVFPIYTLGWSLNYEVMFYALFSIFIGRPRNQAVALILGTLLAIVALGHASDPKTIALSFWSQPIILEFALGIVIGMGWISGRLVDRRWCLIAVVIAITLLLIDPLGVNEKSNGVTTPNDFVRLFDWGIPAALLLFSATFFEKSHRVDYPALKPLTILGDASYSLYLMHPFVLLAVVKILPHLGLHGLYAWSLVGLVAFALSIAVACATYFYVEKPLTRRLHGYLSVRKPK